MKHHAKVYLEVSKRKKKVVERKSIKNEWKQGREREKERGRKEHCI